VETIGQTVRRLVERLERTAKARNEAPDASDCRDEFERGTVSGCSPAATAPLNAGEAAVPKIERGEVAPRVSGMLCRQQRGSTGYGPSCRSIPVRPVAANCNKRQWSLRYCEASSSR
jgi:hypothetical protein